MVRAGQMRRGLCRRTLHQAPPDEKEVIEGQRENQPRISDDPWKIEILFYLKRDEHISSLTDGSHGPILAEKNAKAKG